MRAASLSLLLPLLALACGDPAADDKSDDDTGATATDGDDMDGADGHDGADGDDGHDGADGDDGSDGDDGGGGEDLASQACALLDVAPLDVTLGAMESEAGQAVILPDREGGYALHMPAEGDGWMTVEVVDWMVVMGFFTEAGVEYEIMGGEIETEPGVNAACPDAGITDQRWAFHDWGSYVVRVADSAPDVLWFSLIQE